MSGAQATSGALAKVLIQQRDQAVRVLRLFRRDSANGHSAQCRRAHGTRQRPIQPTDCLCSARDRALLAFFATWPELGR